MSVGMVAKPDVLTVGYNGYPMILVAKILSVKNDEPVAPVLSVAMIFIVTPLVTAPKKSSGGVNVPIK
jgi:hypothetical protein